MVTYPLIGGDELSMTQGGNNNTYCQDNELTWLDWELDTDSEDFLEFSRRVSSCVNIIYE